MKEFLETTIKKLIAFQIAIYIAPFAVIAFYSYKTYYEEFFTGEISIWNPQGAAFRSGMLFLWPTSINLLILAGGVSYRAYKMSKLRIESLEVQQKTLTKSVNVLRNCRALLIILAIVIGLAGSSALMAGGLGFGLVGIILSTSAVTHIVLSVFWTTQIWAMKGVLLSTGSPEPNPAKQG